MHLQPFELQLAFYVDRRMVEYVKNTEDWLKTQAQQEDPNLISSITNLVNRIKRENPELEFKINQMTIKASTEANGVIVKDNEEMGSDLDMSEDEVAKQEEKAAEVSELELSDDE